MKERIEEKIKEIEEYVNELYSFFPQDFEEYLKDKKTKAACEHYFEKIIEALADLAFLVLNHKRIDPPKDDISAFLLLSEKDIISNELAKRLKEAKGMRNFISHEYGDVDDQQVFDSNSEEL